MFTKEALKMQLDLDTKMPIFRVCVYRTQYRSKTLMWVGG